MGRNWTFSGLARRRETNLKTQTPNHKQIRSTKLPVTETRTASPRRVREVATTKPRLLGFEHSSPLFAICLRFGISDFVL
jgi:hypothetical protein